MKDEKIIMFIKESMKFFPLFRKKFMHPHECSEFKLTPHQMYCLMIVYRIGTISMSELASKLGVSNQQLTRIMDSLVEKDFVERYNDSANRRVVQTKITESGICLIKKFELSVQQNMAKSLETLDENQIDECLMHLQALGEILSKVIK